MIDDAELRLSEVTELENFIIHHVGGRNGSTSFGLFKAFSSCMVSILYDADPDCMEQAEENNADWENVYVFPYCLGNKSGKAKLNINYDPFTSSLLSKNENFDNYYQFNGSLDYMFEETLKPMKQLEVELVTLDEVLTENIPKPDFLSLDTQGTEFEVFEGAKNTLSSDVVGIICEVEFRQIYKNQKLFEEIKVLLEGQGFMFMGFTGMNEWRTVRRPVGLRGLGVLVAADAFFLRPLSAFENIWPDPAARYMKAMKLALIALRFMRLEIALEAIEYAVNLENKHKLPNSTVGFVTFLKLLLKTANQMPQLYPKTFAETFNFKQSLSRSRPRNSINIQGWKGELKIKLLKYPKTLAVIRALRKVAAIPKTFVGIGYWNIWRLFYGGFSPLEKLLSEHDLHKVAEYIRAQRLRDTPFISH